jgi:hypothetical protein
MGRGPILLLIVAVLSLGLVPSATATVKEYEGTGPSEGSKKAFSEEAEQAAREQREENERAAHKQQEEKEHTEREAKAAEEQHATEEREQREQAEREHHAKALHCLVPSLKGDSLKRAAAALKKNHCQLGRIGGSHAHPASFVVIAQKLKAGSRLPAGTAVGVTLGRPRH